MLDRIVPTIAESEVGTSPSPVTTTSTIQWEAIHTISSNSSTCQQSEVLIDPIHPALSVLQPVEHLGVGIVYGKSLEDVISYLGFLKAHTVDDDSAYLLRWEETVEDMGVSATLNPHHMFVEVGVGDVVTTFSFMLKGAVLPITLILEYGVHLEGYLVLG